MRKPSAEVRQILEALEVLVEPGNVHELRVPDVDGRKRTDSGYFNDMEKMALAAASLDGRANVYFTLNPVQPALLARAANRLQQYAKFTTSDPEIHWRHYFPIDTDPIRPAHISSNEEEHEAALERSIAIAGWLSERGWPDGVRGDSGNGGHLLYSVDMPNDDESTDLLQRALQALHTYFSDKVIKVDTGNFNAARIWKLYGTLAAKGDSIADRPHRRSRLLEVPSKLSLVPIELIRDLANHIPKHDPTRRGSAAGGFDLARWIAENNIAVERHDTWQGSGEKWVLSKCYFSADHTDGAFIAQLPSGAITAGCHHERCRQKRWQDLREIFEPGCYDAPPLPEPVRVQTKKQANPKSNGHVPAESNGHAPSAEATAEQPAAAASQPAPSIAAKGDLPYMAHPETGETLYLPRGYYVDEGVLFSQTARGAYPVYIGHLSVIAAGVDISTGQETMTVRFHGRTGQPVDIVAPRADLARGKGCIEQLGAKGAAVHEQNSKNVARFLVEFYQHNRDAIPYRAHSDRLGLVRGGLVLPAGSVGFDEPVIYHRADRPKIHVGHDLETYPRMLKEILTWSGADGLVLMLALSLGSPAIARLRPRRNPVVYYAGDSGSGKTTAAQTAVSVWGDPTRHPFRIEAGRTTRAGYLQSLEEIGGLILFIDEAHTAADPTILEALAYQFANGEAYVKGSVEGKAKGGELLSGAMFLAGEAILNFKHQGAQRRTIWLDANDNPPLGIGTIGPSNSSENQLGAQRARLLEQAWEPGAGQLGLAVARRMWEGWGSFAKDVEHLERHEDLRNVAAWKTPLAIGAAALRVLFAELDLPGAPDLGATLTRWSELLSIGHEATDPATEAWERIMTMLAQADIREQDNGWTVAKLNQEVIAAKMELDEHWRVLTGSTQFETRIGKSAVQLYGRAWLTRKWIEACREGKPSQNDKLGPHAGGKCIHILQETIECWADGSLLP